MVTVADRRGGRDVGMYVGVGDDDRCSQAGEGLGNSGLQAQRNREGTLRQHRDIQQAERTDARVRDSTYQRCRLWVVGCWWLIVERSTELGGDKMPCADGDAQERNKEAQN